MAKTSVVEKLRKACEGLSFPSETDAPIEVLHFPGAADQIEPSEFRVVAGPLLRTRIDVLDADAFFAPYCTERPEHDAGVQKTVKRFQKLKSLIDANLEDVRVYRLGRQKADLFVVGVAEPGDLVALRTHLVET